ncbi:MFS transporter [Streptomyces sp. SID14478]|uniref:MFS transporter n=1 Tax=Streptomyces sp. SID14478 TaxID=2706073 RepID=UPI0013E08871|nr:MFS transporter [Streptomyces sp. SID14478]NEB80711.1 MFS transporter [Streptomyces sp. SID14478]
MDLRIFTEPQQGATYDTLLTVAKATEDLGFDAFFRSDHYLRMGSSDGLPGPTDAWVTLAGLARETKRIRLGTLMTAGTFRLPGVLAIQVAQVDQMSGGRVELGLGGAAMFATTLPIIGSVYQGRQRSVALGVFGAVSGGAAAIGPVLGGLLTEGPGWRWIFWVNLPVSVVAVWLTLRAVPESRGPKGRKIDWAGTVSFAAFAGGATYAVIRAGEEGWGERGALLAFAVAAVALVAFVLVERRSAHPMLDLGLLRRPAFVGVMLGAFAFNAAAFGVLPYLSLWLQTLLGMSPVRGGLVFLSLSGVSMLVSIAGGKLLHGVPARITVGGGLVLIGVGVCCQGVLDAGSSWGALVPGLVLTGVGVGLVAPGIAGAALATVEPARAGMAGGSLNTFRQLGYALGIAVFGTVLISRMQDTLPRGAAHALAGGGAGALRQRLPEQSLRTAFAQGLNSASVLAGCVALGAGFLVLVLVRSPKTPVPEPTTPPKESLGAPR